MTIYAIIYLIMVGLTLLIVANKHGQDRVDQQYNIWLTIFNYCIVLTLLYLGGFFDIK